MTQREEVLRLLQDRGTQGVSAHELIYELGITRAAAVIWELRHDGYPITTLDEGLLPDGRRRLARYILEDGRRAPDPIAGPPGRRLGLPCGCVREADGRSWVRRCSTHSKEGRPQEPEVAGQEALPW